MRPGDSVSCGGFPLPLPPTARCGLDANLSLGRLLLSKVQFAPGSTYRSRGVCTRGWSPSLDEVRDRGRHEYPEHKTEHDRKEQDPVKRERSICFLASPDVELRHGKPTLTRPYDGLARTATWSFTPAAAAAARRIPRSDEQEVTAQCVSPSTGERRPSATAADGRVVSPASVGVRLPQLGRSRVGQLLQPGRSATLPGSVSKTQ